MQEILVRDEGLYPEKLITGYFGTLTERALKKFQKEHHLPESGITDEATRTELNIVSKSVMALEGPEDFQLFDIDLKRGSEGAEVEDLQQFLIREGSYAEKIVSGYYGPYTQKAVQVFQKNTE